ncbi:MAG: HD domain-containing phosphohydrolase [Phycisphaeraceae bacterium]
MNTSLSRQLTEELIGKETTSRHHLDSLLEVSRAIGAILDTHSLMRTIMATVTDAFGADRSTLFIHDAPRGQLWSRVAQGLEQGIELRISETQGIAGTVFQMRESLRIDDTHMHPLFARNVAKATGYEPRSMLVVPVLHRPGNLGGVLQVMDRRVAFFTDADRVLLEAIAVQVGISLDNARLYEAQERQFKSFVRAFSEALDARDPLTQLHSANVANYASGIAHYLGLPPSQQEWLRIAGLLHDVGKIGTPEAILTKPGKLSDEEFAEMKKHAGHSRRILEKIEFTKKYEGLPFIAAAHHEKLDGTGYPDRLKGDEVPLLARVLCVADIFDALTQKRHYREAMSLDEAFGLLDHMVPEQLDTECVKALKKFMGCA